MPIPWSTTAISCADKRLCHHSAMPPIESEHEILSERILDVPRGRVFEAFANPAVLARWWGPRGSVNVFHTFECTS